MITIEELREHVRVNPEDDHELALIRSAVIGLWERLTGGLWDAKTGDIVTLRVSSTRQVSLWLPRRPITELTTVQERDVGETSWTTLETTAFFLTNENTGEVERIGRYWKQHVKITYSAGYDETTAPAEVRNALFLQARFMVERYDGEKLTVRGQNIGKGQVTFLESSDAHPHFKKLATNYRRPNYL